LRRQVGTTNYRLTQPAATTAGARDGFLGWTPAIIIFYIIVFSPLIITRGQEEPATSASSNTLNQLFWLSLAGVVLISSRDKLHKFLDIIKQPTVILLCIYLALALASIMWSPVPAIAFRRTVLQIILVICIIIPVAAAEDHQRQIDRIFWVFAATIWVNFLAVVLLPTSRLGHEGIYGHKNMFGLIVAFALLFMIYGTFRFKGTLRFFALTSVVICIFELIVSKSKTSLGLSFLIPAISLSLIALNYFIGFNIVFILFFFLFFIVSLYLFATEVFEVPFSEISQAVFGDPTFTGRTLIWDFVSDVINRAPVLGQGFGSFWGIGDNSIVIKEAPGFIAELLQAHNGYLDVLVELGVVGLVIVLLLICSALFLLGRLPASHRLNLWLMVSAMLLALVHNFMESSLFRGYALTWILLLLVIAFAGASKTGKKSRL
jgi:exopolysaccharide production protein ExoQ